MNSSGVRRFALFLLLLLICTLTVLWVNDGKANASCPRNDPCAVSKYTLRHAFTHHRLGHTTKPHFSREVRRKAIRAYTRKYLSSGATRTATSNQVRPEYGGLSGAEWYATVRPTVSCVPIAGWLVQCTQDPVGVITDTDKVMVGCGGAAIVGAFRGGWWGAGEGGGLCLWGLLMSHWMGN